VCPATGDLSPADFEEAVLMWNSMAAAEEESKLPLVKRLTANRRAELSARLREWGGGLDVWRQAVDRVKASYFLHHGRDDDNPWRADFGFIVKEDYFTKLMEGSYDD
jgi:hypothetical protein